MKNLAELKRALTVGTKVSIHNKIKKGMYPEERVIVEVQTNGVWTGYEVTAEQKEKEMKDEFAREHNYVKYNGKTYHKIFLEYQKASQLSFQGNQVNFLAYFVETSTGEKVTAPLMSLKEGETWLTLTVL